MTNMNNSTTMPSMIVVMGVTGAGKSHFINQLAGREVVKEGSSLDSCRSYSVAMLSPTKLPGTQSCSLVPVEIGSSKVLLIDTPGFDDTERTDAEILTEIARILSAQYELGVHLKGVIYIHRITDIRYSRSSVKTFEVFRKICGEVALNNVLLVTSRWTEVDQALGSERERQLKDKFWTYMLGHGSNMSRFHGDRHSAIGLVSQLLQKDPVVLQLQRELVDEGRQLNDTAAGAYVSDNLERLKQQYREELQSLEKLRQDLRENDRLMKAQIQKDWEAELSRLRQTENEQGSLNHPVGTEVAQEVKKKKKSLMDRARPFLPVALGILGMFVGLPPGVTDIFVSWFGESGAEVEGTELAACGE